jgi:hypothetical protein
MLLFKASLPFFTFTNLLAFKEFILALNPNYLLPS